MLEPFKVASVGFDPWNAEMISQELTEAGVPMTEVRQNFRDLSQGMKTLKGLIFDSQLRHGDNKAFRWMLSESDHGNR